MRDLHVPDRRHLHRHPCGHPSASAQDGRAHYCPHSAGPEPPGRSVSGPDFRTSRSRRPTPLDGYPGGAHPGRRGDAVQPFPLRPSPDDQQVTGAGRQVDGLTSAPAITWSQHPGSPGTEGENRDQCVLGVPQLPVAVRTKRVPAVAVQRESRPIERHAVGGAQRLVRGKESGMSVWRQAGRQPGFGDPVVVAPQPRLPPLRELRERSLHPLRFVDPTAPQIDPGRLVEPSACQRAGLNPFVDRFFRPHTSNLRPRVAQPGAQEHDGGDAGTRSPPPRRRADPTRPTSPAPRWTLLGPVSIHLLSPGRGRTPDAGMGGRNCMHAFSIKVGPACG